MAKSGSLFATVSANGQITLPEHTPAAPVERGTRFLAEKIAEGVLLTAAPLSLRRGPTRYSDVACEGEPRTQDEMEAGVLAEARRRHARR